MLRTSSGAMRPGRTRALLALLASAAVVCGFAASQARPAGRSAPVSISLVTLTLDQPAYDVLVPNFERVYPNITVQVTYAPAEASLMQLEATELAAGSAPDVLTTSPGCGETNAICDLASAGDLTPLVKQPWVKRSLPVVTSALKHGAALFGFQPVVAPFGLFTNDTLFKRLGLKVPQTFAQLLGLCRSAQADGTTAILLSGAGSSSAAFLVYAFATATLYGHDRTWNGQLKAGKASFAGTAGWHEALQDFVDMNAAGCFEPDAAGTASAEGLAEFAQGDGLMTASSSLVQGSIEALDPEFALSFHPFPAGSAANQVETWLNISDSLSVNAHASPQEQAAAETFIDFVARPQQDALFAQLTGGVTPYQFLRDELPASLSQFSTLVKDNAYVPKPSLGWWNANPASVLTNDTIGLITGQSTVDGILQAMDEAWEQGPSYS